MKFFIGFLILLNFIYFLWPKSEVQARPEYQRGNNGVSMLLRIDEQVKPPSFESRVPEIYDPLVKKKPAVQEVNASIVQPEKDTKNMGQAKSLDNLNNVVDNSSLGNTQVISDSAAATLNTAVFDSESEFADAKFETKVESEAQLEGLAKAKNVSQVDTEVKAVTEFEAQVEAESEVATGVQAPEILQCFSMGPFKRNETAKKIFADIDAMGVQPVIRDTTEKQKTSFWVYLPPFPSRQKAVDAAEKLATMGVEDYFIISDGRSDNAISLGIFNKKSDSNQRIKEINSLGYTPKVEVDSTEVSVFWIDTQTTKEVDWVSFLNRRFPNGGIENQQRSCG